MDRNYLKWLIEAGKRAEARDLVATHLKENPDDGQAWYELAELVDDPVQRSDCLKIAYEQGYQPSEPATIAQPTEEPPQQRRSLVPILIILIAVVCLAGYAISNFQDSKTDDTIKMGDRLVVLYCEDCGGTVNLWSEPGVSGAKLAGQLPHNTVAKVLSERVIDGMLWYRVSAKGETGWVNSRLVQ